jgi:ferrochelatase
VIPFLENVLRGKNVPRERMLEVAEHYHHFEGRSPINNQNRELIARLQALLDQEGPHLPIYWGNRNWHPLLPETFARMKEDGVTRAFCFITSAFSSYSGCRQYRENIEAAKEAAGAQGIETFKLRVFFNHPGFVEPFVDATRAALAQAPDARILFTAHSIPLSMAEGARYVPQLQEACRLVAEGAGAAQGQWELVYQSRSGPPSQPWLEPDVVARIEALAGEGVQSILTVPIGFTSDHMEVLYDLDTEALAKCQELGVRFLRVPTPGNDPRFIAMIRELVVERRNVERQKGEQGDAPGSRRALGVLGPSHDVCPVNCCPAPQRPAAARPSAHA